MLPAAEGNGLTAIAKAAEAVPVLQGFEGVTVAFPPDALAAMDTVMEVVPEPEVMVYPVGRLHEYVVALVTAVVLNTTPV
jgi:hypothetical protein